MDEPKPERGWLDENLWWVAPLLGTAAFTLTVAVLFGFNILWVMMHLY